MKNEKSLPLPLLILLISFVLGLGISGIGLVRQMMAKKTNEERYQEAYKQAQENQKKLEKRYAEITEELKTLKSQYDAKTQECNSLDMFSDNWFSDTAKCQNEAAEINSQIMDLESEQFEIENFDNTVFYNKVNPMSYYIFYIIGGAVFGLGALGAFIIYLVKGKKTY